MPILGYGDVDIELRGSNNKKFFFRLRDVAYCPGFACNLVSLRRLQRCGLWWDTRNNFLRRRSNASIVCHVLDRYDQFVLEDLPYNYSNAAFVARRKQFNSYTRNAPSKALAYRWHQRLGHPGPQVLEHLVNHTQGVRIKGPTTVECDACGVSKAKLQIDRQPRSHDEGPGQRLAMDLFDFKEGFQGYRYLLLITDRWSGLV